MKMQTQILALLILISISVSGKAQLKDLVQSALSNHPQLKMAVEKENQAFESWQGSKSTLYPTLDLVAVTSAGFPGSNSPLPPSFGGMMTSPYRVGASYGLLAKYNLLDIEKYRAQDVSLAGLESQKVRTQIFRQQLILKVVASFLEAARFKSEEKVWAGIQNSLSGLSSSTQTRIKSGQINEVSYYLISEQLEEAKMNLESAKVRYSGALERLSKLVEMGIENIDVPAMEELPTETDLGLPSESLNWDIKLAQNEIQEAKSRAKSVEGQSLPKIFIMASVGYLSDTRVVDKQDYSGFIGISLPLFEGFKTQAEGRKAGSQVAEKELQLRLAQLQMNEVISKLDEEIAVAQKDFALLTKQKIQIDKTLVMARGRYIKFLGSMADFREALRVKSKVDVKLISKKADLIYALQARKMNVR